MSAAHEQRVLRDDDTQGGHGHGHDSDQRFSIGTNARSVGPM
jgi:hypothetical protein